MTENNDKVYIMRHSVAEVQSHPQKKTDSNEDLEKDKWCCTRIQEARQRNQTDTKRCFREVLNVLLESCGAVVFFILENLFGIIFAILGMVYLKDCTIQPALPISLIVFGVSSFVHGLILQLIRWRCCRLEDKRDGCTTLAKYTIAIATVIHLISLFIAAVIVFSIRSVVKTKSEDKAREEYCHPILFWFSFYTFLLMAIFGLIIIILFCILVCVFLASVEPHPTHQLVVIHSPQPGHGSHPAGQSATSNQLATTQQSNTVLQSSAVDPGTAQQPNAVNQSSGASTNVVQEPNTAIQSTPLTA